MEQIYNYIDGKIREFKTQRISTTQAVSSADELIKYKDLLDSGVITQEEFDAKEKTITWYVIQKDFFNEIRLRRVIKAVVS